MWTLFMFAVEDDTVQQSVDDYARAVPPPPVVPLPALPPLPKLPGCDLAAERADVAADVAAAIAADAGAPAAPSAEDSELVQSFLNDLYLSAMVFGAEHPEKVAAFTSQAEALRALAEEVATGPRPDDPGPEVCDLAAGEVEPLPFSEPPADAEPYTADLSFLEPPADAAPEVTGGEGE
jgi:hypothetical protein